MCDFPPAYTVARKAFLPTTLKELAKNSHKAVRMAAVENYFVTTDTILSVLIDDPDPSVCATALARLVSRFPELSGRHVHLDRSEIIIGLMERSFADSYQWERAELWTAVTRHCRGLEKHAGKDILHWLFDTGIWSVRLELVNRKDCPQYLLDKLASLPVVPIENPLISPKHWMPDKHWEIRNLAIARGGKPFVFANGNEK